MESVTLFTLKDPKSEIRFCYKKLLSYFNRTGVYLLVSSGTVVVCDGDLGIVFGVFSMGIASLGGMSSLLNRPRQTL